MSLPEFSIKRNVLTLMVSLVLVLFGVIGFLRLGLDKFPKIDFPGVTVVTTMKGSDPAIVDKNITDVIEEVVNQVPGVKSITSSSSLGASVVGVEFELEKNVDVAYQEVKAKVDSIVKRLPKEADPPVVRKIEIGASAVVWVALTGNRTLQELNTYAAEVLKPRLETISGVGDVQIGGQIKRTIRVWLDADRLLAYGLSPVDVSNAFGREHLVLPAGFLGSRSREWLIKFDAEYDRIESMSRMVVAYRQGAPVYLKDVARVEDGLEDARKLARYRGEAAVGLGIVKTSGANTVEVVDKVKERVEKELRPNLPPGLELRYSSDDSISIRQSIEALNEHLIIGTLFAALMVFLFLKSGRSTLIIATAIPVSLTATFAVMYFAGYTLNKITLLGLLLLIGVVVDDAIVVLENIFRHREEEREAPEQAAINGSGQVIFAVFASTLTLVSIFLPVAFISGILGRFLGSFALVVVIGVLASLWVSLTLTPMLCARYLTLPDRRGRVYQTLERQFNRIEGRYRELLRLSLEHRWRVVAIAVAVVVLSGFIFSFVGKTFVPEEDESRFMVIIQTPLGSNLDYTSGKLGEIETVLLKRPEVFSIFAAVGLGEVGQVNAGRVFVRLVERNKRKLSQAEVMRALRREFAAIPGVLAFPSIISAIGGQRGEQLQFAILGNDLLKIDELSNQMVARLGKIEGIAKLDKDLKLDLPEVRVTLDRERAAQLGISALDVAQTLSLMTGGVDVAQFKEHNERYDIRLQTDPSRRTSTDNLRRFYVKNKFGDLVRLDTLAKFEEGLGPAVITRRNRQYAGFIYGSLETLPLGAAAEAVKRIASEIMPAGYSIAFTGQAEEFARTGGYVVFAFSMALIMIYMVLASQFNSLIQPLVVMVAQPLAIIGGVTALWMFGETLNLFSMIGMILLMGLVAKNSILLIDLTNQYRAQGKSIADALSAACPNRMRPVLITSLTVIAAMLPAAIGLGPGVESNRPLALVVMGGMISSTLLTLVVVPAVYSLVENRLAARRGGNKRIAA
ncbi:MAG: acriflavin resistance protein [Candidatus Muproteobacteria bacterium RBG_16_65_31]|uniref:Acriflavin resistance protein n=1 Tax=Candidatus Muproteobacteria bacterium RBG_16_65_31 TaxID=1817759 RepID=A0A1F6TJS3_9PROT|nr:MAG: acriflavin resistance protein [Candidatus Muproteobacteria bacterium RBG_16_65_31]